MADTENICPEAEYLRMIYRLRAFFGNHAPSVSVLSGKGVIRMLTIDGLIAVFSLVLAAFNLGYCIGCNSRITRE